MGFCGRYVAIVHLHGGNVYAADIADVVIDLFCDERRRTNPCRSIGDLRFPCGLVEVFYNLVVTGIIF